MALAAATLLALQACVNGEGPLAGGDDADPLAAEATRSVIAPGTSVRLVDRDVEAPDVFSVTDEALWDGRPSLGGVWVASPDAVDPERVILRNPANGKFVIGALFRRERENPGPRLQISSDAAEALGLLAGQPAKVSVTALRREEEPAAPQAGAPILDTAEPLVAGAVAEGGDALGGAAAALDRVAADGAAPGAELPADTVADGDALAVAAAADAAVDPALAEPPVQKKKKRRWWQRRDRAEEVVAEPVAADPALDGIAAVPIAGEAIATAPIDGAAATAAPPVMDIAALDPAAAPADAVAPLPAATGSTRFQIGIFSVEANAQRAVDTLAKAGILATLRREDSKGKAIWIVTATGDSAALQTIKGAGFADAYALKG